jgi:integrase
VPLRASEALSELPSRLDTRLLFLGPGGALYDLRNFRRREFTWAVEAAGLPESVTPYTLRHSGIS